jgi:hypothetical protein
MGHARAAAVAKPAVASRRPAAVAKAAVAAKAARPTPIARSIQQRAGNQAARALSAQVVARACSGCSSAGGAGAGGLSLSQPDDAHEREAENVAEKVMRMSEPALQRDARLETTANASLVHRSTKDETAGEVPAPAAAHIRNMQGGGGSPLPDATRAFFEPRFGADLSHVRVHTGVQTAQTAESISAKAFTVGSDIGFAAGAYAPSSPQGQKLLAHELTHVLQQDGAPLQRMKVSREPDQSALMAENIIDDHTTLGFLDEEGLGRDLAKRLPGASALTTRVLKELSNGDRDDVSYEIVTALGPGLWSLDEALRMTLVRELLGGVVTDDEEGAVADVWISFGLALPKAAERNRDLWKKSLWESDQLCSHIKPYSDAFGWDVIGVAKAYLVENRRELDSEARRYGLDLDNNTCIEATNPDYLNQVRELVPQIVVLQKKMAELRQLRVGYRRQTIFASAMDEMGHEIETAISFDPDSRPLYGPKGNEQPPWPTWEETNKQYQRINSVISAFASQYPTVYILMQQGKLEKLEQAEDSSKARDVILGAMQKTQGKIDESMQKLDAGSISYYDLKLIQNQLFTGDVQAGYVSRYPWDQPFFQDIGNDDIKGHESREFWVDLGLGFAAAAAIIAAPFTGGASAAFLVGFGVGIGAAQAGMSWDKYLKLSMLSDAATSEELALVAKGEVSAALVEAIINTVAVFLDVFGARGAVTGTKQALKVAEAQLASTVADEARKKAVREAVKDSAMLVGGSALAVGMHELGDADEPVPVLLGEAHEVVLDAGSPEFDEESADSGQGNVSRFIVFRAPGPGGSAGAGGAPVVPAGIVTGADFELHIEKALLQGKVENLPKMSFVLPGQYNPSGWGMDRIGIVFHEESGRIHVFHLEMKWVSPGSPHIPALGTPSVGTQTGGPWSRKAAQGLIDSNHQVARKARRRLKNYLKKINPGKVVDDAFVSAFLLERVAKAPVRVIVPHWADFSKLYKQVAALSRLRRINVTKVLK